METLNIRLQPFFDWLVQTTLQATLVICLILLLQAVLSSAQPVGHSMALQSLAAAGADDSLSHVDEYIAIVEAERQTETDALHISRRLFEAGRPQEALDFLGKGRANRGFVQDEPYDHPTLKVKILFALDRREEVRDTLWQEFTKCLSWSTSEQVLELTPDEQKERIHHQAISLAEECRSPERGAHFLVQMGELRRAARLIEQRRDERSGSLYSLLLKIAKALADSYPSQTWLLYKSLLLDILNSSRYKAYGHAAKYPALMEKLAEKADLRLQQAEFVQMLRQKHGQKSSFWAKAKLDDR